jgi:hypothetical protein
MILDDSIGFVCNLQFRKYENCLKFQNYDWKQDMFFPPSAISNSNMIKVTLI